MFDAIATFIGLLSLSIFIGHATDAYRSRRPGTIG